MMRRILCLTFFCMIAISTSVCRADYIWTGGSGTDIFDETNWNDTVTNAPPLAGSVNPNAVVGADLILNSGGAPIGTSGGGQNLDLGGQSFTISDGAFNMSSGIRNASIDLSGGSLTTQFIANGSSVTLGGNATLSFFGGGNPVNVSTINFTSLSSELRFTAETTGAFLTEHLSKTSINGFPAVVGTNLSVTSDGGSGSIVRATSLAPPVLETLTWTGNGDGSSFDDETNWDTAPTGGTINLGSLIDNYVVDVNAASININNKLLDFASTGSLTLNDGDLTGLVQGLNNATLTVTGGSLQRQWILGSTVTLGGTGEISLNGGNDPLPGGTIIDFTSTTSTLNLLQESVADATSEHLSKFTVNGSPAVVGTNLFIVSDGGSGSIITAVPEPASWCLMVIGYAAMLIVRRRRSKN